MNINFRDILSRLSPRGWAAVGGSLVAAIIFIYVLVSLASSPSYTTLEAGINPVQTSKMTAALSTAGIPYQLQNNGTAIAVETSKEAQARVTLATAGLLSGAGSDATIEGNGSGTSSSLGESNFQQQIGYQAQLESQTDQGIEQFSGINSAQVSIVLPDPSDELFSTSQTPPSASVILNDDGNLSAGTAKAIAQYVENAVPGLDLDKITITDQDGSLLWPQSANASGSGLLSKQQAQDAYDGEQDAAVNAMLASTLGPNKATVEINANLNTNKTTLDSVAYGPTGTPLTTNESNEKLKGDGSAVGGTAGNGATSIPTYASPTNGKTNYTNTTQQNTLGVNKKVTHTIVDPGAINNQSVAIVVNSTVPKASLAGIRKTVENAVGFQAKRGDSVSVTQIPFVKPVAAASTSSSSKLLGDVKWVAVGLGALAFLLFVSRMLRRRENEAFGQPTWLRELETPRSLASLEAERVDDEQTRIPALRSPSTSRASRSRSWSTVTRSALPRRFDSG